MRKTSEIQPTETQSLSKSKKTSLQPQNSSELPSAISNVDAGTRPLSASQRSLGKTQGIETQPIAEMHSATQGSRVNSDVKPTARTGSIESEISEQIIPGGIHDSKTVEMSPSQHRDMDKQIKTPEPGGRVSSFQGSSEKILNNYEHENITSEKSISNANSQNRSSSDRRIVSNVQPAILSSRQSSEAKIFAAQPAERLSSGISAKLRDDHTGNEIKRKTAEGSGTSEPRVQSPKSAERFSSSRSVKLPDASTVKSSEPRISTTKLAERFSSAPDPRSAGLSNSGARSVTPSRPVSETQRTSETRRVSNTPNNFEKPSPVKSLANAESRSNSVTHPKSALNTQSYVSTGSQPKSVSQLNAASRANSVTQPKAAPQGNSVIRSNSMMHPNAVSQTNSKTRSNSSTRPNSVAQLNTQRTASQENRTIAPASIGAAQIDLDISDIDSFLDEWKQAKDAQSIGNGSVSSEPIKKGSIANTSLNRNANAGASGSDSCSSCDDERIAVACAKRRGREGIQQRNEHDQHSSRCANIFFMSANGRGTNSATRSRINGTHIEPSVLYNRRSTVDESCSSQLPRNATGHSANFNKRKGEEQVSAFTVQILNRGRGCGLVTAGTNVSTNASPSTDNKKGNASGKSSSESANTGVSKKTSTEQSSSTDSTDPSSSTSSSSKKESSKVSSKTARHLENADKVANKLTKGTKAGAAPSETTFSLAMDPNAKISTPAVGTAEEMERNEAGSLFKETPSQRMQRAISNSAKKSAAGSTRQIEEGPGGSEKQEDLGAISPDADPTAGGTMENAASEDIGLRQQSGTIPGAAPAVMDDTASMNQEMQDERKKSAEPGTMKEMEMIDDTAMPESNIKLSTASKKSSDVNAPLTASSMVTSSSMTAADTNLKQFATAVVHTLYKAISHKLDVSFVETESQSQETLNKIRHRAQEEIQGK